MRARLAFFQASVALGLLASLSPANGQTVTLTPQANNLYNTGYSGTVLAGPNQVDTHYTLTNYISTLTYQANPLGGLPPTGWIANTSTTQWITVVPYEKKNPTSPPAPYTKATFDYKLSLTNIPVGELVTINGFVAADDNATVSVNGAGPYFTNYKSHVVPGNYEKAKAFNGLTFVSGSTNSLLIAVSNIGGGKTGLNLTLTGSYATLTSTVGLGIKFTPPVPLTTNQTNIINKINQVNGPGVANACFAALTGALLAASTSEFGSDLDQLSPEKLGIFSSIAFNDASFRTSNLDDYTAHRRNAVGDLQVYPDKIDASGLTLHDPTMDPALAQVKSRLLAWSPPSRASGLVADSADSLTALVTQPAPHDDPADKWNFFVSGDVILGQNFSQPEIDHTDYTTSSFQIGSDYQIGKNFLVGTLFNYSHTDTALDAQGGSATIDAYSPGAFASFAQDGWFANALGTWSKNEYTEQRVINIGTYHRTPTGAPEGDEEMGDLDGGYEFHSKHWTFGPTVGIQYVHLNVNSFSESNGCSTDLSVADEGSDSLRSRFGGRISYEMLDHHDRVIFTPFIDASWQHEFLAGTQVITSSFGEVGFGSFSVSTPETSRDSALLVTGLNADVTEDMTLFTNYGVQVGESDYFGQSVQAGMKIGF